MTVVYSTHSAHNFWKLENLITGIFNRIPGNTKEKCEPVDFDLTKIDHT